MCLPIVSCMKSDSFCHGKKKLKYYTQKHVNFGICFRGQRVAFIGESTHLVHLIFMPVFSQWTCTFINHKTISITISILHNFHPKWKQVRCENLTGLYTLHDS